MHALRCHQPQVQVVTPIEWAGPAQAAGQAHSAGITCSEVVQFQPVLHTIAGVHLHFQVRSTGAGPHADCGLRLDARQIGQKQHGPLIIAIVQGLAGLEDSKCPCNPLPLDGGIRRDVDADLPQGALHHAQLYAPFYDFLYRDEHLDKGKAVATVNLGCRGSQSLQVGKCHGLTDLVRYRFLQFRFGYAADTNKFDTLQHEAGLRLCRYLRLRQSLCLRLRC